MEKGTKRLREGHEGSSWERRRMKEGSSEKAEQAVKSARRKKSNTEAELFKTFKMKMRSVVRRQKERGKLLKGESIRAE